MKYGELVTPTEGIFHHIEHEFPGKSATVLDAAFYGLYSQRTCSPLVMTVLDATTTREWALDQLGAIVSALCGDKWDGIEKALAVEYDPIAIFVDKYVEDTSREVKYDGNSSQQDSGKVYGFDAPSDSPVGDRDTSESGENHHESEDKFHREYTNSGNHGRLNSSQQLITQEIKLRSFPYIRQVMADIAGILCLDIYE